MAESDEMDFFSEFDRLCTDRDFRPFEIILVSGARYRVAKRGECIVFKYMYTYLPPKGGVVMFPFSQVSCIEIDYD